MADRVWGAGGDYTFTADAIGNGWQVSAGAAVIPPAWYAVDANTVHAYRCDEIVGGRLVDGAGHCNAVPHWQAGRWDMAASPFGTGFRSLSDDQACDNAQNYGGSRWPYGGVSASTPRTLEGWFYMAAGSQFGRNWLGAQWTFALVSPYWPGRRMQAQLWGAINDGPQGYGVLPTDEWCHVAGVYDAVDTAWLYVNGIAVATQTGIGQKSSGEATVTILFHSGCTNCIANNIRASNVARYPSGKTFYPHVYEATGGGLLDGVVLVHGEAGAQKLTSIAWTGTFGAGTGSVAAVYVNEGTDLSPSWTQVGGASPSSPITGLNFAVPSRCVRISLAPKADALQTASPTLNTVTLGLAASLTPIPHRPPTFARMGPRLIPLGGLL